MWLDSQSIAWEVRQLYASRGHLQAQVTVGAPTFRDADATLPIAIDEGVLSRLVDVRIEGVDPARMTGAQDALGLSIGEPFAASAPVDATRRLKAFYLALGYRNAAVAHEVTTGTDGSVSIAWAVKEGPLFRVKDVNVVGAETTNAGLVQKAITLEPGGVMSQGAVDTTRRNLYNIGSFRRVDFDFGDSPTGSPLEGELPLTLTIQTEEPQRFQLKYGVQFSFDRSAGKSSGTALGASVELRDRNFIGRAVQASIGAHWDPDLQTIGLLFSSPRVFGKPVRTNLYMRTRREEDIVDNGSSLDGVTLDDRRRDVTIEQRWRPASAIELVWGYNAAFRRFLLDQDDQHLDIGGLLAGPVVSVILDKRDSPFDATRGLFHSSSLQFGVEPLGSDLNYVRYLLRQSYYQPLGKLTAAGSIRYGTMQGFSGTPPIGIVDLLFEAGGTNTCTWISGGVAFGVHGRRLRNRRNRSAHPERRAAISDQQAVGRRSLRGRREHVCLDQRARARPACRRRGARPACSDAARPAAPRFCVPAQLGVRTFRRALPLFDRPDVLRTGIGDWGSGIRDRGSGSREHDHQSVHCARAARAARSPAAGPEVSTGVRGPGANSRGRRPGDRRGPPEVHHLFGHRIWRRRRPDVRERRERGLATHRHPGQLHTNHQLGNGHQQRDLRSPAGIESCVVEIRTRLAGWNANAARDSPDAYRQRSIGVAHRRRRRACGRPAGAGGALSVGPLAEPAGVSQGGASARRQSGSGVAVGTNREGP